MHRFFVPAEAFHEGEVTLPAPVAEQVRRVLRLGPGDEVAVFDGSGAEWTATLTSVDRSGATARLGEPRTPGVEPPVEIAILLAVVRAERFEMVLQKGTELGASRFTPVVSERVQGGDAAAVSAKRLERWRRIVTEAAEQSGRVIVPQIDEPLPLQAAIQAAVVGGPVVLLWEEDRSQGLRSALRPVVAAGPSKMALVIGPVGGLADHEVRAAEEAGAVVAGMGQRVLRTETAAIAALTATLYELGLLGG
ncbi:MAG: 16S rRNA (uracil(1498)-N(3))-methyltransferase [Dehalococcoidia bacterium]